MSELATLQKNLPGMPTAEISPLAIIQSALQTGIKADELGKLMDLQDRWEANQARKAFMVALSAFQADCPIIQKTARGDKATYAPLEQVIKTIQPILERHGLSVRFDTDLTANAVDGAPAILTATCYVSHVAGHTEQNHFAAPVDAGPITRDGRKVMNSAQSVASARSYCKRYALGDALNLAFSDEDDDGEAGGTQYVSDVQAANIQAYLDELKDHIDMPKFWRVACASSVDQIPETKYGMLVNFLKKAERERLAK